MVRTSALIQDAIGVCKTCGGLSCPAHGGKSQTPAGLWNQSFQCCYCLRGAVTRSAGKKPPPGGSGGGGGGGQPPGGPPPRPGGGGGATPPPGGGPPGHSPSGPGAVPFDGGEADATAGQPHFRSTVDFQAQFPQLAEASQPWRNSVDITVLTTAVAVLFELRRDTDAREQYLTTVGDSLHEALRDGYTEELQNRPIAATVTGSDNADVLAERERDGMIDQLRGWLTTQLEAWMAEIYPVVRMKDWLQANQPGGRPIDFLLLADAIGLNAYAWDVDPDFQPFKRLDIVAGTEPGLLVLASLYAIGMGFREPTAAPVPVGVAR
ncbi:hypothetical protein [Mycobacterium sp. OTB74]|uniref:hypothetical protein n=1 Tax=Mycobacterium sp. OTB74 TaxID=1853452 RepID=UPI002476C2DA|nr:hypothetical protein [Mycobacterium sp. OTB74]